MDDSRSVPLRNAPIARGSDEWARLEYLLQLSLRSTGARVTSIYSVAAPHLTVQFEARTAGQLVLDSWVDTRHLGDLNTLGDVCTRGFRFPPTGMIFPTGMLVLPPGNTSRSFEVLLCKVGVGRYMPVDENNLASRPPLPDGYQSYYLHKVEQQSGADTYYHEYLMLDPLQVLPCYVVQFEMGPDDTAPLCDVCNTRPAITFCAADNARLCHQCDDEAHSVNKLAARHIRVPLQDAPAVATCGEHGTNAEYFCNTCGAIVCVHCKMVGSHSSGEAAQHRLVPLAEAYRNARQAVQRARLCIVCSVFVFFIPCVCACFLLIFCYLYVFFAVYRRMLLLSHANKTSRRSYERWTIVCALCVPTPLLWRKPFIRYHFFVLV